MGLIVSLVVSGLLAVAAAGAFVWALAWRTRALTASQDAAAKARRIDELMRDYGPLMSDVARLQWVRAEAQRLVYKIGMTRRLDPMDRVVELGDASVPFPFDVHAMIRTENAPELERLLHQRFSARRVNMVNERKEFFRVHLDDVERAVCEITARLSRHTHREVRFTRTALAEEYRKTAAMLAGLTSETAPSPHTSPPQALAAS